MNQIKYLINLVQFLKNQLLTLLLLAIIFTIVSAIVINAQEEGEITERRITVSEFRDKMKGGWIGQMVGVGWGASTEFSCVGNDSWMRAYRDSEFIDWLFAQSS